MRCFPIVYFFLSYALFASFDYAGEISQFLFLFRSQTKSPYIELGRSCFFLYYFDVMKLEICSTAESWGLRLRRRQHVRYSPQIIISSSWLFKIVCSARIDELPCGGFKVTRLVRLLHLHGGAYAVEMEILLCKRFSYIYKPDFFFFLHIYTRAIRERSCFRSPFYDCARRRR